MSKILIYARPMGPGANLAPKLNYSFGGWYAPRKYSDIPEVDESELEIAKELLKKYDEADYTYSIVVEKVEEVNE